MKAGPLRDELDQHRHRSVCLRRRLREEAIRHLSLHHHAPELDLRQAVEALHDQGRRNVVRQVGHELVRAGRDLGEVELQRVAEVQLDVGAPRQTLFELRRERAVELDSMHPLDAPGQVSGENPEPGADLEHDVATPELGEPADHGEDVLVDEEVLAELFLRRDVHPGRSKHSAALPSMRCASSSGSSPRARASASTVCTT